MFKVLTVALSTAVAKKSIPVGGEPERILAWERRASVGGVSRVGNAVSRGVRWDETIEELRFLRFREVMGWKGGRGVMSE